MAACTEAVTGWAAVLRSRRLLVAGADPDCAGARTAIDAVLQVARDAADVTVTEDLDAVPDQAIVTFPAHGAPLPVRAEAAARGLQVVDATCPLAAAAHQDVRTYADRGDTVVLITGSRDTAARHVSVSQAQVRRIAAPGDIAAGWLAGVDTVGVVLTRSAGAELVVQVRDVLSGLGPLSVATRQVRTSPACRAGCPPRPWP